MPTQTIVVLLAAFLFGFGATAAGTKCLIAVEKRRSLRAASWGLVVDALAGAAILLVVFTDNLWAFVADILGSFLAEYIVVERQRRKEMGQS